MTRFTDLEFDQLLALIAREFADIELPQDDERATVIAEAVADLVELGFAEADARKLVERMVTAMVDFAALCTATRSAAAHVKAVTDEGQAVIDRHIESHREAGEKA